MRSIFLSLCLAAAATASAQNVFPYHYQNETLPNGLRVILIPMPGSGLISYWSIVRTGSRDEIEPGKSGYAHFFEHMMFRGTEKHPNGEYDRLVTAMGADSNAFTENDLTAFYLTFAKEDLPTVIELESDRFQRLKFDLAAFQTEAGAVYGEFRKDETQPDFILDERLHDTAFDVHTYKHTTMGFEADVKAMPKAYDYAVNFHRRFYRPENVVLLVVGDIEPAAVMKLINEFYGGWQRGYTPARIPPEPPQKGERHVAVSYPGKTLPILDLAYRSAAFDPDDRDYVASRLLMQLAFGETSKLYQKLVLEQQKVEAISGDVPLSRDPSLLEVTAVIKRTEDIEPVRGEIERTIREFQTTPVDAEKLARVKRHEKYSLLMTMDSPANVAGHLVPFIGVTGGIEALDHLYATAERVTPEDIQRAAKTFLDPKRRTVAVLKGTEQ